MFSTVYSWKGYQAIFKPGTGYQAILNPDDFFCMDVKIPNGKLDKWLRIEPPLHFSEEEYEKFPDSRCTHVKNDTHKSKSVTFREPLDLDMHMTKRHEC